MLISVIISPGIGTSLVIICGFGTIFQVMIVGETPAPFTMPLVLEEDLATREPLLQVDTYLLSKLKPHQRQGKRNVF